MSPKLTLNLGLRWETESPITEKNNQLQTWNANSPSYFGVNPGYDFNAALVAAGLDPSQVQTPAWVSGGFPKGAIQLPGTQEHHRQTEQIGIPWNFAPRLGAAYQLTPLTVLRGSFAILYAPTSGDLGNFQITPELLIQTRRRTATSSLLVAMQLPLSRGIPALMVMGSRLSGTSPCLCPGSQVLQRAQNNIQANFSRPDNTDREQARSRRLSTCPWNMTGVSEFSGSCRGMSLWKRNILVITAVRCWPKIPSRFPLSLYNGGPTGANAKNYDTLVSSPVYGQGSTNPQQLALAWLEYPYPYYGLISVYGLNAGTSNFNALNLRLQKRFSDGFQFLFNYTWSKLLDDVGGSDNSAEKPRNSNGYGEGGRAPQSVLGFKSTYGLDPTNQTSRISAVYSYQFPLGRGKKYLEQSRRRGRHFAGLCCRRMGNFRQHSLALGHTDCLELADVCGSRDWSLCSL